MTASFLSRFDEFHEQAMKATGFDDFGASEYTEPLKLLLADYDKYGSFTPIGEQITSAGTVGLLAARLFAQQGFKQHPDFIATPIEKPIVILGRAFTSPVEKYLVVLGIVSVLTLLAANMARGSPGRAWMAVRDMDVAAEVTGLSLLRTKLQAFAISSFYCGVGGALYTFAYLQTVEPSAFTIHLSFYILFMALIGGLGTIIGAFFGAAFILLIPIFLNTMSHKFFGDVVSVSVISALEHLIFGVMIVAFLIFEPLGLARIWQLTKERLRLWPFRH